MGQLHSTAVTGGGGDVRLCSERNTVYRVHCRQTVTPPHLAQGLVAAQALARLAGAAQLDARFEEAVTPRVAVRVAFEKSKF
jgi:hypothetical protein